MLLAALGACSSTPTRTVSMEFGDDALYAAPFPGEHLRDGDGRIDLSRAPNPLRAEIVDRIHLALAGIDGFGTTSPVHFRLDGDLDESLLPDAFASLSTDSPILLIDVDPDSPERGRARPFDAFFQDDAGPYGDRHMLTLVPVQGVPLRARTLYAALVTDRLRGAHGEPMARAPAMQSLLDGTAPAGLTPDAADAFLDALATLRTLGQPVERLVAMTAFRTADPLAVMRRAVDASAALPPLPVVTQPAPTDTFDDFCVLEGTVRVPVFQAGSPPYLTEGGGWVLDGSGTPVWQHDEDARVVVTLPRAPMPARGFPTTVLVRTGAGGNRPLVDRGTRAVEGGEAVTPGTGPALEFARAGFAGVSIEGPHGGSRNVSGGDEQFLVFNIQNPIALRDNLRQSALELVLLARVLDTLTVDARSCPGLVTPDGSGQARFDTAHLALMGHSMGASIAPIAAAFEPRYGAVVLSGAGGSWLENVLHKERPLDVRPLAEALLRYSGRMRSLRADDPMLGLLQWAGEAADTPVYARLLVDAPEVGGPRHVLMFQGIVDHYILPPIANALSISLAVDRAGPALDSTTPELAPYRPLDALLPLRGRGGIPLPAQGNRMLEGAAVTAVVVQHPSDGIEDGHEIVFQTEGPRSQYRCFLRTFAEGGAPHVPVASGADLPCD